MHRHPAARWLSLSPGFAESVQPVLLSPDKTDRIPRQIIYLPRRGSYLPVLLASV